MSLISKDTYLLTTDFADDWTVLNMLSVNPAMAQNFETIMKKRYPRMIKYKKPNESWRFFYLKTIHYLGKLSEEYEFRYPLYVDDYGELGEYFNPEQYYEYLQNHPGETNLTGHLANNWYRANRKLVYQFEHEHPEIKYSVLFDERPFLLFDVREERGPYPEKLNGMPIVIRRL